MTTFSQKVYALTRMIPKGKVATYGQIAALAGSPRAARAVGALMANNPDMTTTPCHRVVGADGSLIGYSGSGGVAAKMQILKKEGVHFEKNKVHLTKSQWSH